MDLKGDLKQETKHDHCLQHCQGQANHLSHPSGLTPRHTPVLRCAWSLSHAWLFASPWTTARQATLSVGILQARILEWLAMPSSRGTSKPRAQTQASHIAGGFWATRQAQEYWSGQPIPSPGGLPDPGIQLRSPALQADTLPADLPGRPGHTPTLTVYKVQAHQPLLSQRASNGICFLFLFPLAAAGAPVKPCLNFLSGP